MPKHLALSANGPHKCPERLFTILRSGSEILLPRMALIGHVVSTIANLSIRNDPKGNRKRSKRFAMTELTLQSSQLGYSQPATKVLCRDQRTLACRLLL